MPERKRPTVAIVAAHERRKTVDDILNTVSFTAEVRVVMLPGIKRVGRRFLIIWAHTLRECGIYKYISTALITTSVQEKRLINPEYRELSQSSIISKLKKEFPAIWMVERFLVTYIRRRWSEMRLTAHPLPLRLTGCPQSEITWPEHFHLWKYGGVRTFWILSLLICSSVACSYIIVSKI